MKHHGHTTSEITSICIAPPHPTRGHVSDEITRLRIARHRFVSRPKVNPPSPCRRNLSPCLTPPLSIRGEGGKVKMRRGGWVLVSFNCSSCLCSKCSLNLWT